jgi:hypothetical protein
VNPTIRIRGVSSINASDPFILDGAPFNGNIIQLVLIK